MINSKNIAELASASGNVLTQDGTKIGSIGQFYVDDATNQPSWVTAKTGLFGISESFVPLTEASTANHDILVPYSKDKVKGAPRVDAEENLSPAEEAELYRYYDLVGPGTSIPGTATVLDDAEEDDFHRGTADRTITGERSKDAMTGSEEQAWVGAETFEAGHARLRKYVVTENLMPPVPVSHEEVRPEREPITEANRARALDGAPLGKDDDDVTLHGERRVMENGAFPAELVGRAPETATEQQTVSEDVRKEKTATDVKDLPYPGAGR